jgi:DNA invertase Pin-like site-specific DNA recombinase
MAKVAIYSRVSTGKQNTGNQIETLRAWAHRCGHDVIAIFEDVGVSGAKGREHRPQFDLMLRAAVRRDFDMLAVWSSDRLGRSVPHLVEVLQTIRATGIQLYVHSQSLDTTTPSGRAMFQMLAVFSEFERELIVARVNAGLDRARREGKRLGRPELTAVVKASAIDALRRGASVREAARVSGVSVGAAAAIRRTLTLR